MIVIGRVFMRQFLAGSDKLKQDASKEQSKMFEQMSARNRW